jgi:hypothetical protein
MQKLFSFQPAMLGPKRSGVTVPLALPGVFRRYPTDTESRAFSLRLSFLPLEGVEDRVGMMEVRC